MPPLSGDDSSAAYVLRDNLERVARYRNVLELRNPNPTSRLLGTVRLLVRRQAHDGRWTTLEPEPETSLPLLHEGERVGFEVANDHSEPIYLTLLDFGLTAASARSTPLPLTSGTHPLEAGRKLQIGFLPEEELIMGFPDDFPFVLDPDAAEPLAGLETVKLFATTYPTDFSGLLLQEGLRGSSPSLARTRPCGSCWIPP